MVASSRANLFASAAAGVCALWGPLHGGANQAVLEMLEDIHRSGDDGSKFIAAAKDKNSGKRLMGFGHRVYKNYDPRAKIIKKACDDVLAKLHVSDPLLDIAKHLEQAALQGSLFCRAESSIPMSISTAASSCGPSASRWKCSPSFLRLGACRDGSPITGGDGSIHTPNLSAATDLCRPDPEPLCSDQGAEMSVERHWHERPALMSRLYSIMNIHEYQAKQLLAQYGVTVPPGEVCDTPEAAKTIAEDLFTKGATLVVVKSQIHAGGRGKGTFKSGFQGGVKLCKTADEVFEKAKAMLGNVLVTKQTGAGRPLG